MPMLTVHRSVNMFEFCILFDVLQFLYFGSHLGDRGQGDFHLVVYRMQAISGFGSLHALQSPEPRIKTPRNTT